ncbi:MAG: VCBS repeat-containing protein [Planctomycetota bacterium]|nr:VCBS repeat-containing protein [Planctomycetota bacterium]
MNLSRMKTLSFLLTLGVIWMTAQGSVPGYASPPELNFKVTNIEIGGKLTDAIYEDLNGDKKVDLLITKGREIQVFFQEASGFPSKPNQRWKFDRRAVLFDTVDLKGDGKRQILFLAKDGVYTYDLVGKQYRLIRKRRKKLETLTRRPSKGEIRRKDLCRDLNGDGLEDLLIPEATGMAVYFNVKGKFGKRRPLFVPPNANVQPGNDQLSSRVTTVYWFSNPSIVDFNKDGRKDMILPVDDMVKVFPQDKAGNFPEYPASQVKIADQKLLEAGERPDFELDVSMPLQLIDLNNDGYVDMLSTHVGQGVTRIFMGSKDGVSAFKKPTHFIRAKGVSFFTFTVDLDGDGLLDLVVPRTDKIGIWYLLKVLVTRSVKIDALCYYQRKNVNKPFPDEPDFSNEIEIPLTFKSTGSKFNVGTSFVASISGDFNKDGRKDVLYRTEDDELGIFYGRKGRGGFPEDPSAVIKVKDVSNYRFMMADVPDLNADGRSDVVLKYYSWDRKSDRVSVHLSKDGQ